MKLTPLESWVARKIGQPQLTRARLENYQLEKLRETIQLAHTKSAFYRKYLANAPRDLAALDDLAQFPFTTAHDLRANPLQLLCTSQDDIHRVVTLDTSGTTGEPKRIYFTRDDQELTIDFFRVGMSTFTDPDDVALILLPCERPGSVGDLLALALERFDVRAFKYGPGKDERATLDLLAREKVTGIVGTPTQVLALARQPNASALRMKSVLLSTDHVPNALVNAIERAWHCTVYNHYGMTEMGLGGGVECAARRGYHLREADLFFEIVHPQTGERVAEGETGEVVFTTLTRRGMPLIRYRTGDLSRFIPGQCACGTTLKTLARITTRVDGFVRFGASFLTMADLDEAIFPIEGVVNFAATLARETARDQLDIRAQVPSECAPDALHAIHSAVANLPALESAIARKTLQVHVTCAAENLRVNGKRQIAVSTLWLSANG